MYDYELTITLEKQEAKELLAVLFTSPCESEEINRLQQDIIAWLDDPENLEIINEI